MEEEQVQLKEKLDSFKEISVEKIDTMNTLTSFLLQKNSQEADELAHRAVMEARSIAYAKGEATALMHAGMYAYAHRHFADANDFYRQSLLIFEKENDEEATATLYKKLGNLNLQEGKYVNALDCYNRSITIREKQEDELGAADLYSNSATILGLQGSYTLALQSHLRALKVFEKHNELNRIASVSSNIGIIHKEQQHYEEALKMFNHALKISEEGNDLKAINNLLNNIGGTYQEKKNFPEALRYHERALRIGEQLGDKAKIALSFSNIGNICQATSQKEKALEFYNKALELCLEINERRGLVQSYNNLGEIYFEMQNYEEAHRYLNLAISLAEETGLKNQLRKAVEFSSETFALQKRYKEAYFARLRFTKIDKDISNLETHKQIAQMSMRHEMEQKERAAEIERKKNAELTKAYNSLDEEKKRSEGLLLNILPEEVAEELKENGRATAKHFDQVTILFTDFVGFTKVSERLTPQQLVDELHECFKGFDEIISKYSIEKIKTIGDAYLAVSGLPNENANHAIDIIKAAIEIRNFMVERKRKLGERTFEVRLGVHTGSVVAGIVGMKKFAYDVWGDAVNTAARMEQNSLPGKINVSQDIYELVKNEFNCKFRGEIEAKNKGMLKMYFVE